MATKSFIQLSGRTKPTDLDVLALVDSGYTTTYQITRQNLLNSSSPLFYVDNKQNILSKWCDDTSMSSGQWFSTIIGGSEHRMEGDNFYNTILGGKRNRMTGGSLGFRTIIGGYDNRILNANGYNGIFAGYNNEINGGDYGTTIIGGYYNTITNGAYGASMIGSFYATMNTCGTSVIAAGASSTMNSSNDCFMGGGRSNTMNNGYGDGGSAIIAGNTNNLTGNLNAIIGGNNNTITGGTNVIMLGTSGRTADATYTTYVENLRVFRQAQYGNFNNGSRATNYTIDWNNGNIQKVILTGSCVFSATNITDGTTYIFKVEQDNSGNRAATWSSGIFKFANSTPPTLSTGANDVDIFTFVAMDGLLYGVAQLNFG